MATARRVSDRNSPPPKQTKSPHVPAAGRPALPPDILATKLYVPRARPNVVRRQRLLSLLDEGIDRPLTLLSAPAGFGKTTLVSDWVENRTGARAAPLQLSWLSLDEADNDPVRFMRYLAAALLHVTPRASRSILTLLRSPQAPPSLPSQLAVLVNELVKLREDYVLVLDDYHLLRDRTIHEAVAFLLEHVPPRFHLLIATREDPALPLARLRGGNAVAELRQADLRFTADETAAFLQEVMGLTVTPDNARALEERTEGWIAGLQMAALSLRGQADVAGFIAAFSGSDRHILDYLVEEVLNRQPEAIQDFLLRTSILDRLTGPLCDAVLGDAHNGGTGAEEAGRAQDILESLEHANLFLVPLDAERRWYRYHPLFADLLRLRLRQIHPHLVPELQSRASAWYERSGLIPQAIDQALAAGDAERAAHLIEHNALLLVESRSRMLLAWLDSLSIELVRCHPNIAMVRAMALALAGDLAGAESHLKDVEDAIRSGQCREQAQTVRGMVAAARAGIALYLVGDLERGLVLSQEALDLLPATDMLTRPSALLDASTGYLISGDVGSASERAVAASEPPRTPENLRLTLRNAALLARLHVMQGRLHQAASTYARVTQLLSEQPGLGVMIGGLAYHFGMGDLLRERNELEAAERHLTQGLDALTDESVVLVADVLLGYTAMADVRQARGDGPGAIEMMEAFITLARRRSFAAPVLDQAVAAQARLRLRQGDVAEAARWADRSLLPMDGELQYPREAEYLTFTRLRIAQKRAPEALPLLERLLGGAEAGSRMGSVIEILILRALALQAEGKASDALADLERALTLAEPEGYVRLFADEGQPMAALLQRAAARGRASGYIMKLLAATRAPAPGGHEGPPDQTGGEAALLVEPLTGREREVLLHLAAEASNAEIARKLVLTVSTVKTHVHNIFGKLSVRSRTQAIAKARSLNLF